MILTRSGAGAPELQWPRMPAGRRDILVPIRTTQDQEGAPPRLGRRDTLVPIRTTSRPGGLSYRDVRQNYGIGEVMNRAYRHLFCKLPASGSLPKNPPDTKI